MLISITKELVQEALHYANMSKAYTSNRHDFHEGGLDNKQRKMFEGKLGEKGIKKFFIDNSIQFDEDDTSHDEEDKYDFVVYSKKDIEVKVDVKTRTKDFHTRTLEMVEQIDKYPKDVYISTRLFSDSKEYSIQILGFSLHKDFKEKGIIENNGYLDNYVLFDNQLRDITGLIDRLKTT